MFEEVGSNRKTVSLTPEQVMEVLKEDGVMEDKEESTKNWAELILKRFDDFDPKTSKDNCKIEEDENYICFPATIGDKPQKYFRRIEDLMKSIKKEYEDYGISKQLLRDAKLWRSTLRYTGTQARKGFLRRIFMVLRYGGFYYASKEGEWREWSESGWPIATALSHGSRVMIQTPKSKILDQNERDHSFWKWLITGSEDGDLTKFISTSTSGDEAEKNGQILFKRLGATHSIDYKDDKQVDKINEETVKYIYETKTNGLNFRDTKVLQSSDYVLHHHRHWGCNIPIGGHGRSSFIGEKISSNGEHGHLYIYYMSASPKRNGGILLGLEGSEYQKWDQVGHKHAIIADSSSHSPTWGFKWRISKKSKTNNEYYQDLSADKGPMKYNGMFIDLSTGWEYLKELESSWDDDFVMETSKKEKNEKIKFSQEKWKKIDEKGALKQRHATVIPTPLNQNGDKSPKRRIGFVPSEVAPQFQDVNYEVDTPSSTGDELVSKSLENKNKMATSMPSITTGLKEEKLLDFD